MYDRQKLISIDLNSLLDVAKDADMYCMSHVRNKVRDILNDKFEKRRYEIMGDTYARLAEDLASLGKKSKNKFLHTFGSMAQENVSKKDAEQMNLLTEFEQKMKTLDTLSYEALIQSMLS